MGLLIKETDTAQKRRLRNGKARHRVELWDQMHLFFGQYNDHQLHCALFFSGHLDCDCLKRAVVLTMTALPELGSKYVEGRISPYWEEIAFTADDIITLTDSQSPQTEIDSFLTGKTDPFKGPQLKMRIVRSAGADTLCIVMNHMLCDGAGFKAFLYLLASTYTSLKKDAAYTPEYKAGGSRSASQILEQICLTDKIKAWFMPNYQPKQKGQKPFPLSGDATASPYILTHKLDSEQFLKLKQYGKARGATVNDIMLAAYIRALDQTVDVKDGAPLSVACVLDLRRYLRDTKTQTLCNLTSTILCDSAYKYGESFDETVAKVKRTMDKQKDHYPGLKGLLMLSLVFRLFPYSIVKKLIGKHFVNPLFSLSNIGIIDESKLAFEKLNPEDAFITGAIKYYPYFLLALTSFRDSVTFTVSIYGTDQDRRQVEAFFTLLDIELKNAVLSGS
jgi:NRPS condensation-like uncharacterized protein